MSGVASELKLSSAIPSAEMNIPKLRPYCVHGSGWGSLSRINRIAPALVVATPARDGGSFLASSPAVERAGQSKASNGRSRRRRAFAVVGKGSEVSEHHGERGAARPYGWVALARQRLLLVVRTGI